MGIANGRRERLLILQGDRQPAVVVDTVAADGVVEHAVSGLPNAGAVVECDDVGDPGLYGTPGAAVQPGRRAADLVAVRVNGSRGIAVKVHAVQMVPQMQSSAHIGANPIALHFVLDGTATA